MPPQAPVAGYQPYYQPMPYPPQMMGRPEHPHATTVLILGILGICLAGILGPVAWIMGNNAIKECQSGLYALTDQLKIGRILGIIATIMLIVWGVLLVAYFVFILAVFSSFRY